MKIRAFRVLVVAVVVAGLVPGAVAQAAPIDDPPPSEAAAPDRVRVVVQMRSIAAADRVVTLAGPGSVEVRRMRQLPYIVLEVPPQAIAGLENSPLVEQVDVDVADPPTLASSVPVINGDDMQLLGHTGAGATVAILDTGVDADHPFFGSRIISQYCSSSATGPNQVSLCPNGLGTDTNANVDGLPACLNGGVQLCSHGTHVAGIAAGSRATDPASAPGNGVAPGANIIAIQVFTRFNDASSCLPGAAPCVLSYLSDQIAGLDRLAVLRNANPSWNIAAANMSLGGGSFATACDGDSRKAAIDTLLGLGVATVIASGNSGFLNSVGAPGCISSAFTVGSTTDADAVSSFSNRGGLLDVFAPGSSIDSSVPNNSYANFQGTSMATPHVAGALAMFRAARPATSITTLMNDLRTTGVPITYSNGITNVTTPRIDVLGAFSAGGGCPNNDSFACAATIGGPSDTRTGSNVGYTGEVGEPVSSCGGGAPNTAWWNWTAPGSGNVTIDTFGSSFDTVLAVYTGSSVAGLTQVVCNDDTSGLQSQVRFPAVGGTTYRIQVDGFNTATGAITLHTCNNDSFAVGSDPSPVRPIPGRGATWGTRVRWVSLCRAVVEARRILRGGIGRRRGRATSRSTRSGRVSTRFWRCTPGARWQG